MDNKWDTLRDEANKLLDPNIIQIKEIESADHDPHPYVIDSPHVVYASDNYGGMLTEDAIRDAERYGKAHCGMKGCTLPYDQHTSKRVAFVVLQRNVTEKELVGELLKIKDDLESKGVDGFGFLKTSGAFQVTRPEEDNLVLLKTDRIEEY